MKRVLSSVIVIVLVIVLCTSAAFAAGNTYYLEEMGADIALPSWEDYYYLYPNMPEDSEDLSYLELTPQQINDILIPNGILFDALYYDASHEIAVQVNEQSGAEFDSYTSLNELERAAIIAATTADLEQMGYAVNSMEWVDGTAAVWLVTEFVLPEGSWAYQYHTIVSGKTLLFTASSASGVELTDEIRQVTADMALGTVFHSDEMPGVSGGNGLEDVDLGSADVELMAKALGLSMEELEQLVKGEMSPNDLDLNKVDLEGVVNALGMSEEDVHDIIRTAVGSEELDLSGLKLNEVDVAALLDATGLTVSDVVKMGQGEMDPADFDMAQVDPEALLAALGLSTDELIDLALSAVGFGGLDWKGLLGSIGRGALIGAGVGIAVVIVIIILLAVTGRKKRGKKQAEPVSVEGAPEE